jgi:hypothetical protein
MASMRFRNNKAKTNDESSNNSIYDSKHGDKKMPNLTIAMWAVVSMAVIFLFANAVTNGSADGDNGRNLQHHKNSKHNKKSSKTSKKGFRISEKKLALHQKGFGTGKKTTPCPEQFKKKFWIDKGKINQAPARAFRMQGWEKTDNYEEAQVIWTYVSTTDWYDDLQPWQRYNHMHNYKLWNRKDTFVTYMLAYAEKSGKELPAIPETYRLDVESDLNKFKKRLFEGGGINIPWVLKKPSVNQGKGITMLGPNTKELKHVLDTVEEDKDEQNYIIQRYVCNEMTINNKKFDFRIFWIVASLDPLIIMYHDGYLRIGNSEYNEQDFSSTTAHLTTHTGLSAEGKGTWDNFSEYLEDAVKTNPKLKKIKDPTLHVKNQVKQALGEFAAGFKESVFNVDGISSENGFGFYGGDFIIDWDLDVFFIEPQHGCGLDEDFQFRVDMHNSLFTEMIDATEEIWERQERGLPTDNKSLENLGGYEIVYNDGWMYEYEGYVRSKDKKGCEVAQKE